MDREYSFTAWSARARSRSVFWSLSKRWTITNSNFCWTTFWISINILTCNWCIGSLFWNWWFLLSTSSFSCNVFLHQIIVWLLRHHFYIIGIVFVVLRILTIFFQLITILLLLIRRQRRQLRFLTWFYFLRFDVWWFKIIKSLVLLCWWRLKLLIRFNLNWRCSLFFLTTFKNCLLSSLFLWIQVL